MLKTGKNKNKHRTGMLNPVKFTKQNGINRIQDHVELD